MLAPEMIVFTAWVQRREAQRVTKTIEELLGDKSKQKSNGEPNSTDGDLELNVQGNSGGILQERQAWTKVHSFYAVMGGFAFDSSNVPVQDKFLPGSSRERVTLSPKTVCFLAKHEPSLLPDLSRAEILDKSKANQLAKGLVCLQAVWFIAQCITRLAHGLSISLLELNTFAHTVCTLLIYVLWWNKPLDIEQPTLITGTRMHCICAYLCYHSTFDKPPDSSVLEFVKDGIEPSPVLCLPHSSAAHGPPITCFEDRHSQDPRSKEKQQLYMGQSIAGVYYPRDTWRRAEGWQGSTSILNQSRRSYSYSFKDRRRWELASQMYRRSPSFLSVERGVKNGLRDRVHNWPEDMNFFENLSDMLEGDFHFSGDFIVFFAAFTVAGIFYGSLHLLAWNSPFTSRKQRLLWRISGTVIAASGPAAFLIMSICLFNHGVARTLERIFSEDFENILSLLPFLILNGSFIIYVFARTYLVIECFLSLAYIPISVSQLPEWSSYFPHIT